MRMQALAVALCLSAACVSIAAGPEAGRRVEVRIGLPESLFRDVSPEAAIAAAEPLVSLLRTKTGIHGEFSLVADSDTMAEQLDAGKLHIGVMQGVEYAWLRDRHPRLKPVLLACNENVALRAVLVVHRDANVRSVSDLKNKPFAMPKFSLNHCYFFLDAAVRQAGHDPETYFAPASRPANPEAAMDAVVDGKMPATVVDSVAFKAYGERKQGRGARLRVVGESCPYPTAAFVARADGFDAETIKNFREGMTQAHRSFLGKQVLTFWRLTSFEPVPDEYRTLLAGVLKVHPEPMTPASFMAEAVEATAPR